MSKSLKTDIVIATFGIIAGFILLGGVMWIESGEPFDFVINILDSNSGSGNYNPPKFVPKIEAPFISPSDKFLNDYFIPQPTP